MTAEQIAKAQEVFGQAIELPRDERQPFVTKVCSEAKVRAEVEQLLASIEEAGAFLSAPALPEAPTPDTVLPDPLPTLEQAGTQIGRYKLIELLGQGGFGAVFLARQQEPVQRDVALKIIKLGMDTREVIARFEAERQALAMMDHPNIARVLDAGATETGRPYFVMELVRGVPITTYCDQNKLRPRERLELFVAVCLAMQHAHQKGIIHRDLKPNNVLVTLQDGKPVPKVIDFGIAKATDARLTDLTLLTAPRQLIGTPQYMSPEQTTIGADIDTRSDIYSLGVLLYELLTGTTPFSIKQLKEAAYDQIGRIIREVDPPRPSTRIADLGGDLPTIAAQRATEVRRLASLLRGELNCIAMKCLEKDRSRRYAAAGNLAADIAHHLANEPIEARPSSRSYRLRKFFARHKRSVIAVSIAFVGLTAGTIAATLGYVNARHERDIAVTATANEKKQTDAARAAEATAEHERGVAVQQEKLARLSAAEAASVNRFLENMLVSARPEKSLGEQTTVRQIADRAAASLHNGEFKDQPALEAAIAHTLGRTYVSLGQYRTAEMLFRDAIPLTQKTAGSDSAMMAALLTDLAVSIGWQGDFERAVSLARRAVDMSVKMNGESSEPTALAVEALAAGISHLKNHAGDEVHALAERALSIRAHLGQVENKPIAYDLTLVAETLDGDDSEKEKVYGQAIAMERKLLSPNDPDLAFTLYNYGELLFYEDKDEAALAAARESLAIKHKVLDPDHPDMEAGLTLMRNLLLEMEDWKSLEPVVLERYRWESKQNPDEPDIDDLQALVETYVALGRNAEAETYRQSLQAAVSRQTAILTRQISQNPLAPEPVERRAELEGRFGRFQDAADDFRRAIELHPQRHDSWYHRACLLAYLGDAAEYRLTCRGMLKAFAQASEPDILERTAKTCLLLPDPLGAQSIDPLNLIDRALTMTGNDVERRAWYSLCKGIALYRRHDYAAAITWLEKALKPQMRPRYTMTNLFLAMVYDRLGQDELAQTAFAAAKHQMDEAPRNISDGDASADGLENWLMCQVSCREAEALLSQSRR